MTKIFAAILTGSLLLICTLALVIRNLRNGLMLTKYQLATAEKERDGYAKQVQRLTNASEITNANRKEADEKIDNLHNGDAVDNALSELSKHKN